MHNIKNIIGFDVVIVEFAYGRYIVADLPYWIYHTCIRASTSS
jgi:hypothetical protein